MLITAGLFPRELPQDKRPCNSRSRTEGGDAVFENFIRYRRVGMVGKRSKSGRFAYSQPVGR